MAELDSEGRWKVTVNRLIDEKPNLRQYNPLNEFSSSTYKLSLYLITPDAYVDYNTTGKWQARSLQLIAQSGGITEGRDSPRNEFFDLDLYIDNFELTNYMTGQETGISALQTDIKFQIYEPYGMSFPTSLLKAVRKMQEKSNIKRGVDQPIQALGAHFLMAVRFYGYNAEGTPMVNVPTEGPGFIDSNSSFERTFPFLISKFSFRLENKVTVYDVQAKPINEQIGFGLKRGVVLTQTSINASTVEGAIQQVMHSANYREKQNSTGDNRSQDIADIYEVVFDDSPIKDALIVDKGHYSPITTPMPNLPPGLNVRVSESGKSSKIEKRSRNISIPGGEPIMSVIDKIITQSSFVGDSLSVIDKNILQKVKPEDRGSETNPNPSELYWYHVTPVVRPIDYDKKRNDYAYKITYYIQRYEIPYVRSLYTGNTTSYKGAHKIYNYWYTGKNESIISYEHTYNLLYFNAGNLASDAANQKIDGSTPNKGMPAQGANPTGMAPGALEAIGSVRTFLYSPGDVMNAHIRILGDPDYLVSSGSMDDISRKWYGNDLTINPGSGQVFIEIDFRQVKDYDNNLGIMQPDNDIYFWEYDDSIKKVAQGRMVYMLLKVISRFSKGKFEQDLKTGIPSFPTAERDTQISGRGSEESSQVVQPNTTTNTTTSVDDENGRKLTPPQARERLTRREPLVE